ncbi:MAG: sugar transferase, partial [Clostridia bacterium]|nr:sugar transferase [Clostridia bacterium]
YRQTRIGKDGKPFVLIKFRTMRRDAHDFKKYFTEEQLKLYNSEYKLENDPRITPMGKFLRRFSIDEFPQFINVIKGEMSIIGPRPLTNEETYFFGENRDLLLSVRPGITGLWQVSGRNLLTYESGDRQRCELTYVENFGFKMDMKVFFKTFAEIFSGKGR